MDPLHYFYSDPHFFCPEFSSETLINTKAVERDAALLSPGAHQKMV
jgi:hypothetical protein